MERTRMGGWAPQEDGGAGVHPSASSALLHPASAHPRTPPSLAPSPLLHGIPSPRPQARSPSAPTPRPRSHPPTSRLSDRDRSGAPHVQWTWGSPQNFGGKRYGARSPRRRDSPRLRSPVRPRRGGLRPTAAPLPQAPFPPPHSSVLERTRPESALQNVVSALEIRWESEGRRTGTRTPRVGTRPHGRVPWTRALSTPPSFPCSP